MTASTWPCCSLAWGAPSVSPRRPRCGLSSALAQGGEFAFVLFTVALDHQVMRREWVDLLIVVVTLSMVLTPVLYTLAARVLARAAAS